MTAEAITPLPRIMVAPNGARLTRADHPALPVTIAETIETARACFDAGAGGIHAHVRDADGRHVLDAGLYRNLLDGLREAVPGMACQITTEAVGRYSPAEQIALVRDVRPQMVSVALRELTSEGWNAEAEAFYQWCAMRGIAVQHILYDPADLDALAAHVTGDRLPARHLQLLFVLGRYAEHQTADPADLDGFIAGLARHGLEADWAVCAFGQTETDILARTLSLGGKVRVGFENNLINRNGTTAASNAERVAEIVSVAG
jgi:3-keto-5-aminohexanoate cleavage enzyme